MEPMIMVTIALLVIFLLLFANVLVVGMHTQSNLRREIKTRDRFIEALELQKTSMDGLVEALKEQITAQDRLIEQLEINKQINEQRIKNFQETVELYENARVAQ